MVYFFAGNLGELLEQFPLLGGQAPRGFNHDFDQLVAATVTVKIGETFALEPKHLARLGSRGNLEFDLAVQGRDFHFGAQCSLRKADRHLDDYVVVLTRKNRMFADMNYDIQVARRPPAETGLTFAAQL